MTSLAACTAWAASGFALSSSATEAKPKLLAVVARMPVGAKPAFCNDQPGRLLSARTRFLKEDSQHVAGFRDLGDVVCGCACQAASCLEAPPYMDPSNPSGAPVTSHSPCLQVPQIQGSKQPLPPSILATSPHYFLPYSCRHRNRAT